MSKFIKVHSKSSGREIRINADHILSYCEPYNKDRTGTIIEYALENSDDWLDVEESVEEIDKLVGL